MTSMLVDFRKNRMDIFRDMLDRQHGNRSYHGGWSTFAQRSPISPQKFSQDARDVRFYLTR
jgi:hypothetical protein